MKHRMIFGRFIWHWTISGRLPKLMLMPVKHKQRSYDGLQCPDEWPSVLKCFYNVFTVTSKHWDSVRRALQSPPDLNITLILCPNRDQFRNSVRPAFGNSYRASYCALSLLPWPHFASDLLEGGATCTASHEGHDRAFSLEGALGKSRSRAAWMIDAESMRGVITCPQRPL